MPYTSTNKIPMPSENASNNSGVVGQAIQQLENLLDGSYSFSLSGGSETIDDTTNYTNNAVYGHWVTTGTITANRELIAPARVWQRFVTNNCTGSFTVKVVLTAGGSGITVASGSTVWLRCDGTTITSITIPASLTSSGVTAGSYTNTSLTVNANGIVTAASSGTAITANVTLKSGTDCSANPNYPSAVKGDMYWVTVAGKIGGASGADVTEDGVFIATANNAGGDQATVGSSWLVISASGGSGATTLDGLTDVVITSPTSGQVVKFNGTNWVNDTDATGGGTGVTSVGATAPIASSGGTTPAISISAATTSAAGSMSSTDKTKLDGIASGATANSSDATLLARANHTGTQAISTVVNLQSSLDAKVSIAPRVSSITNSATPSPDSSTTDLFTVTALAAGATFAAPSGTPSNGQKLMIRIKDNGTARTLAWNAIYRASTDQALPTTTTISKTMYIGFIYNSTDSKWDCLFVNNGF